jgi:hypothetical protein
MNLVQAVLRWRTHLFQFGFAAEWNVVLKNESADVLANVWCGIVRTCYRVVKLSESKTFGYFEVLNLLLLLVSSELTA